MVLPAPSVPPARRASRCSHDVVRATLDQRAHRDAGASRRGWSSPGGRWRRVSTRDIRRPRRPPATAGRVRGARPRRRSATRRADRIGPRAARRPADPGDARPTASSNRGSGIAIRGSGLDRAVVESLSAPALVAFAIGAIGLIGCTLAMSQVLPPATRDWRRRLFSRRIRDRHEAEPETARRRIVTGPSAAERLAGGTRPPRQVGFRPDVLRRERERLAAVESRRAVEQLFEDDVERLAQVVGHLVAQDGGDAAQQEGSP